MTSLLAIDTSTDACSAALLVDGQLNEQFEVAPRQHATLILTMVESLLGKTELSLKELDAIAFAAGPASFTGIRIATSVAQGLAYAAGLQVAPISSLQAIAQTAYKQFASEKVAVALDAYMGEVYWGVYQLGEHDLMQAERGDQLCRPEAVQLPGGDYLGVGDAWQRYSLQLPKPEIIQKDCYPRASRVAELALVQWQSGKAISPELATPVYLRQQNAWRKADQ